MPLHVSTEHTTWSVTVDRWGATREQVWQQSGVAATHTPAPVGADAHGCDWPVSLEIPTEARWRPGFYLVTVSIDDAGDAGVEPTRTTAYAGFVVRPAAGAPHASMLLVCATNTWNAYNIWGGASLYTGGKQVSFRRPWSRGTLMRPDVDRDDRKSRPRRFGEEPDVDGDEFQAYRHANGYPAAIGSTGWYAHERRFVEWAEAAGWEFDLCVSSDLDLDPTVLDGYDVLIDVGHDEYWSAGQRQAVDTFVADGGQFASLSGNTCFWQVRLEPGELPGGGVDPAATMVCHKYTAHETDAAHGTGATGMWADPTIGQPEWSLLGAASAFGLYSRFGKATPRGAGAYTVYRHDHWMFESTNLRYGDVIGIDAGVVGYETVGCPIDFDHHQLPIPRTTGVPPGMTALPTEIDILAFAPASNVGMGEYPASISALSDQGDLEFLAERLYGEINDDSLARCRYGNSVMSVCRPFEGGGTVVVIGSTDWVFGLGSDPVVQQITANILDRLSASS